MGFNKFDHRGGFTHEQIGKNSAERAKDNYADSITARLVAIAVAVGGAFFIGYVRGWL